VRERTFSLSGRAPDPFRGEEFRDIHGGLLDIIRAKGWTHCVVFYDEANRLTEDIPVERLVNHEEALTIPGRISVYAATHAMAAKFDRLKDHFGDEVVLKPFQLDEVKQLLSSYWLHNAGGILQPPVTDVAVEQLWKSTHGQPYRVQLLARYSFTIANEQGASVLSREHVDAGLERFRQERPGEFS
jgi:hypothetical protein